MITVIFITLVYSYNMDLTGNYCQRFIKYDTSKIQLTPFKSVIDSLTIHAIKEIAFPPIVLESSAARRDTLAPVCLKKTRLFSHYWCDKMFIRLASPL